MQTVLPLAMIVTYPGEKLLGIGGEYMRTNTGFSGVMAENNRWSVLVPIATILLSSAINLFVLGPATTKKMKQRHHQGKHGLMLGMYLLLTVRRNAGRKEELRQGSSIRRNAKAQQGVWQPSRYLYPAELCGLWRNAILCRSTWRQVVVVSYQNQAVQHDSFGTVPVRPLGQSIRSAAVGERPYGGQQLKF